MKSVKFTLFSLLLVVLITTSCASRKELVYLQSGSNTKELVSYEPVLQPDDVVMIVVSSENGILKVKYDNNSSLQNVKTEVTVYTNDFKKLDASSAGRIFISDDFKLDKLALNLHSAGQISGNIFAEKLNIVSTSASGIDANVQAKNIDVEATSASKVKLSGTTNKINVEATSTAKVYLENLKYQNLNQEVTSLAKVYTK